MKIYMTKKFFQFKICSLKKRIYDEKLLKRQLILFSKILELQVKSQDTKDDLIYKIVGELGKRAAKLRQQAENQKEPEKTNHFSVKYIYSVEDWVFDLLNSSRQLKRLAENFQIRDLAFFMTKDEKDVFGLVEEIVNQSGKWLNHTEAKRLFVVIQKVGKVLYEDELAFGSVFKKEPKQRFVKNGNGRAASATIQIKKFENEFNGKVFTVVKKKDHRPEKKNVTIKGKTMTMETAQALGLLN